MSTVYVVSIRLVADGQVALLERLEGWGVHKEEAEGILSISAQPEIVQVPPDLAPPPIQPPDSLAPPLVPNPLPNADG